MNQMNKKSIKSSPSSRKMGLTKTQKALNILRLYYE